MNSDLKASLKIKIETPQMISSEHFSFYAWWAENARPEIDRINSMIDAGEIQQTGNHNQFSYNGQLLINETTLTHEALLIGKRPIDKACKHLNVIGFNNFPHEFECQFCRKKLNPNWTEA